MAEPGNDISSWEDLPDFLAIAGGSEDGEEQGAQEQRDEPDPEVMEAERAATMAAFMARFTNPPPRSEFNAEGRRMYHSGTLTKKGVTEAPLPSSPQSIGSGGRNTTPATPVVVEDLLPAQVKSLTDTLEHSREANDLVNAAPSIQQEWAMRMIEKPPKQNSTSIPDLSFAIHTQGKSFWLAAPNAPAKAEWIRKLHEVMQGCTPRDIRETVLGWHHRVFPSGLPACVRRRDSFGVRVWTMLSHRGMKHMWDTFGWRHPTEEEWDPWSVPSQADDNDTDSMAADSPEERKERKDILLVWVALAILVRRARASRTQDDAQDIPSWVAEEPGWPVLGRALDVDAIDADGLTALHHATMLLHQWPAYREERAGDEDESPVPAPVGATGDVGEAHRNNGDLAILRLLLWAGADAAIPTPDGETALHVAVKSGQPAGLSLMLVFPESVGGALHMVDDQDRSPLLCALVHSNEAGGTLMTTQLLQNGADADSPDTWRRTPLMWLLAQGDRFAGRVEVLRRHGANPNRACLGGSSVALAPIHIACGAACLSASWADPDSWSVPETNESDEVDPSWLPRDAHVERRAIRSLLRSMRTGSSARNPLAPAPQAIGALLPAGAKPNLRTPPGWGLRAPLHLLADACVLARSSAGSSAAGDMAMAVISAAASQLVRAGARLDVVDGRGRTAEAALREAIRDAEGQRWLASLQQAAQSYNAAEPPTQAPPMSPTMHMRLTLSRGGATAASSTSLSGNAGEIRAPTFVAALQRDWVPDDVSERCLVCGNKFSVFSWKHHCRSCNVLCCGACSSKTFPLYVLRGDTGEPLPRRKEAWPSESSRVCDGCFNFLCHDARRLHAEARERAATHKAAREQVAARDRPVSQGKPRGRAAVATGAGDATRAELLEGGSGGAAAGGGGGQRGMEGAKSELSQVQQKLSERGERLQDLGDRTERMEQSASEFNSAAEQLLRQQKKQSSLFGGFFG